MTRLTIIALVLIVLLTVSCSPGGSPASTVVTEKQQVTIFLKAAAPIEREVAVIDSELADFTSSSGKLTVDQRNAQRTEFSNRLKAAKAKATAIPKPSFPEAAAFYDKWLASITIFEAFITAVAAGDVAAAEKVSASLNPAYNASDAALATLLAKYSISKAEVSWPT
jgi:hypothetical protein